MSFPDGALSRDEIFRRWIAQVFVDLKAKKITREEAATLGGISRNQTYQWEGRGKKGYSRPTADKLKAFCTANGLDWRIPFGIFGWDASGRQHVPEPKPETEIERRKRLIKARLDQDPPREERRELEIVLVQLEAAERMQASADAAAARALRKYGHGAA